MINSLLCLILGHKLHYKGQFHFVRADWYFKGVKKYRSMRCYRCGCEVEKRLV